MKRRVLSNGQNNQNFTWPAHGHFHCFRIRGILSGICGKSIPFLAIQHLFLYLHHHHRFHALQCDALFTGTADPSGNSPIVAQFSAHAITGLPNDWLVTLYDTGKATMVRITTPVITPPPGTTPEQPYSIMLSSEMKSDRVIDTREPIQNSAMFRPVRDLQQVSCPPDSSLEEGTPRCYRYLTSLYADYQAPSNASVNITSSLAGKNSWKIFEPKSNEYTTTISLLMSGEHHGWATMNGTLSKSIGIYDAPDISP